MPNQYTVEPGLAGMTASAFYDAQETFQEIQDALTKVARLMDDAERYAGFEQPSVVEREAARDAIAALPDAIAEFEQLVGRKLPVLSRRVARLNAGRA